MNFTETFLGGMIGCKEFEEALSIVNANSMGGVWLIGGSVFRTLTNKLYGTSKPAVDFDFIVEKSLSVRDFNLPEGWRVGYSRLGSPKFIGPDQTIDFVPLKHVYSILHRNLDPSLDAYLTGVPLNVQSIVYDVNERQIKGDIGIAALTDRIIAVNDIYYAKHAASIKGVSLREYIDKYAAEMNFTPVYPY